MKGVTVEAVGAPFKVVDNLEKPTPGPNQILVKSITVAINPVDTFMQASGMLVPSFPVVLGCDASGLIVQVGTAVSSFKIGQRVAGCTRLGVHGCSTFQEFFCMDARLTLPVPEGLSFQQAATLGVGTYTACLGLFQGLRLGSPALKQQQHPPAHKWVVILGGAGSVGQYSVQIAKALGYKVVATCSLKTAGLVKGLGADATIAYNHSEGEQLEELRSITGGGDFAGVWDAVAKSEGLARRMLDEVSIAKVKRFATTDDWSPMGDYTTHETCRVALGPIGRAEGSEDGGNIALDDALAEYIPFLVGLLEKGMLRPNEFKVVSTGLEGVAEAIEIQQKGTMGGAKVLVDLQSV